MGENREYLTQSASDGSINISEDVVVAIASEAIGEIEGVGAMMTTMTEQLTEQFMGKKPARGIRMDIQDGEITLDVYLTVKYGFAIPETAAKVQDAVSLASVIGEDELSETDKLYLKFGREFENRFLRQGMNENRSIDETLDLGWEMLRILPESELDRVSSDLIEKYYKKKD